MQVTAVFGLTDLVFEIETFYDFIDCCWTLCNAVDTLSIGFGGAKLRLGKEARLGRQLARITKGASLSRGGHSRLQRSQSWRFVEQTKPKTHSGELLLYEFETHHFIVVSVRFDSPGSPPLRRRGHQAVVSSTRRKQ